MSEHLRIRFHIGSSFDADYELIDWGESWHGQHVRVICGADPGHTVSAQDEARKLAGWVVGQANTPLMVASLYNALLDANEAETRRRWPDYEFAPDPRMKGIVYLAWDVEPKWKPDYEPGVWHWEFKPLEVK